MRSEARVGALYRTWEVLLTANIAQTLSTIQLLAQRARLLPWKSVLISVAQFTCKGRHLKIKVGTSKMRSDRNVIKTYNFVW